MTIANFLEKFIWEEHSVKDQIKKEASYVKMVRSI